MGTDNGARADEPAGESSSETQSTPEEPGEDRMANDGGWTETKVNPTDVETVRPMTGRRLSLAVGTFVVTGAGFIFTLFFVNQFTGGGGSATEAVASSFTSSILGGIGVAVGFLFALLLSPLVALVVGLHVGRDGGDRAVFDAGIGSTVGFLVMFFTSLVLASSLGGAIADAGASVIQAGPLLGLSIGVGLTGAGAAKVGQSDASLLDSVTDHEFGRPVSLGLGTFVTFGLGYAVTMFLAASLAETEGSIGLSNMGTGGVVAALGVGVIVAPLVAVLIGRFVATDRSDRDASSTAAASGLAAAIGVVGMMVTLYLIILVLEPNGAGGGDFPLGPLIGFVVGTGLTGGASGFVSASR